MKNTSRLTIVLTIAFVMLLTLATPNALASPAEPPVAYHFSLVTKVQGWQPDLTVSASAVGGVTEQFQLTTYVVDESVAYCYDRKNYPAVHPQLGWPLYNNAAGGWHNGQDGPCHASRTGPIVDNTAQWFPVYVGPTTAASDRRDYSRNFSTNLTAFLPILVPGANPLPRDEVPPTLSIPAAISVTAGESVSLVVTFSGNPTTLELIYEPYWLDLIVQRDATGIITSARLTGVPPDTGFKRSLQVKIAASNAVGSTSKWLTIAVEPAHVPIVITIPTPAEPDPIVEPPLPPVVIFPTPTIPSPPQLPVVPPEQRPIFVLGPAYNDEIWHNRISEGGHPSTWFKEVSVRRDPELLLASQTLSFDVFFSFPYGSITTVNPSAQVVVRPRDQLHYVRFQSQETNQINLLAGEDEQLVAISALRAPVGEMVWSATTDAPGLQIRTEGNRVFARVNDTNAPAKPTLAINEALSSSNTFAVAWNAVTDLGSGLARFAYQVDQGRMNFTTNLSLMGPLATSPGRHVFRLYAVDWAGNYSLPAEATFEYRPPKMTIARVAGDSFKVVWPEMSPSLLIFETSTDLVSWKPFDGAIVADQTAVYSLISPDLRESTQFLRARPRFSADW
jgi:hypothetical protein